MAKHITIGRQGFMVSTDSRTNTDCIRSIHPYDETEYHWARRMPQSQRWMIYYRGKPIVSISANYTEEQVAETLLRYDDRKGLRPRICHN